VDSQRRLPAPGGFKIAEEQAALRRVAVLMAQAASPDEVFAAITEEAGRLLGVGHAVLSRYDPADGLISVVAAWSSTGTAVPAGTQASLGGIDVHTLVFQTGRGVRLDSFSGASEAMARFTRELGIREAVGVPVSTEGRLWGVMIAATADERPLPTDAEARLAGFTELAATAIASAQARVALRSFADEQAALRRVATLVARGAPPEEVFAAVAAEAGRLLGAGHAVLSRYDPDSAVTVVATWSSGSADTPVGTRVSLGGHNVTTMVFQTGREARMDDCTGVSGAMARVTGGLGLRGAVGAPVSVEGRLWGVMVVTSWQEPLPADTATRLAGFAELAATAIAGAQARTELRVFADEQAALHRVATLVAQGAPPPEVFAAVTGEAGQLLQVDHTILSRYDPDGQATVVAAWARTDRGPPALIGLRFRPEGRNIPALVLETGQPARIDDYGTAGGAFTDVARDWQFTVSVGVPIRVEGRLWGVMVVASPDERPLPADTETRLAAFTELTATALANAEAQAALTASRARIVAAADAARRRIERNLHDSSQQRLVSLALHLREVQATAPPGTGELARQLDGAVAEVNGVLQEVREIARGLHPAVLSESGLRPALRALARRSAVPVRIDVHVAERLPEPVEIAAYYTVAEALANTTQHARASAAEVEVAAVEGMLRVRVRDDGHGGADIGAGAGSGLAALKDRVEALGGRIFLNSPRGAGTNLRVELPYDATAGVTITGVPRPRGSS
jgi:signal transduction histidine kinase